MTNRKTDRTIDQDGLPQRLAKQLKEARHQKGLSQKQLAGQLHVSRQTISNWENGRAQPDYESLSALAAALDLNLSIGQAAAPCAEPPSAPKRRTKEARPIRSRRRRARYRLAFLILLRRHSIRRRFARRGRC